MAMKKSIGKRPAPAKPSGGKGSISFYFSFLGSISRELYTGAQFVIGIACIVLGVASNMAGLNEGPALWAIGAAQMLLLISLFSIGYKRAHALGISGFYSIAGMSLFSPFFMLFKPAADAADDRSFAPRFDAFKKIGAFFTKNTRRYVLYLFVSWAIYTCAVMLNSGSSEFNYAAAFMACLFAFRLIQLPFITTNFVKKYYVYAVKTLSFIAYTALVIYVTIAATYLYILIDIYQTSVGSMATGQ
jgi:hypothetical protein